MVPSLFEKGSGEFSACWRSDGAVMVQCWRSDGAVKEGAVMVHVMELIQQPLLTDVDIYFDILAIK